MKTSVLVSFMLLLSVLTLRCFALLQPLTTDEAFQLTASLPDTHHIAVQWKMAPNYYLYRESFEFHVSADSSTQLGTPQYPETVVEFEDVLGKHWVYQDTLNITLPILKKGKDPLVLNVHYQGCTHSGFCYPPTNKQFTLALDQLNTTFQPHLSPANDANLLEDLKGSSPPATQNTKGSIFLWFSQQRTAVVLLGFLGFGLLLTFTPCVLPMLPILSSIVLGKKELNTYKALAISSAYVLGMSLTFALAGVIAALIGQSIQAYLQNPWVIGSVSVLLLLLALSLLGCYEIHMPHALQQRLQQINQKQQSGTYVGAFLMGALATLVVSPCVTPPLIGALTYIAHSGDVLLGSTALFIMGLGMGIPLIAVTTLGTRYLPKSGPWMNSVKAIMGLLLLAVVILLMVRIVPGPMGLLFWAFLLLITALYLGLFNAATTTWQKLAKAVALLTALCALTLTLGAALGHDDPLHPLAPLLQRPQRLATDKTLHFKTVYNMRDLARELAQAKTKGQWSMVDFWAKWCLSCTIMDQTTFQDPKVKKQLASWDLIKVDITKNSQDSRKVQHDNNIIAPPVLLFYPPKGIELTEQRIIGEISGKLLNKHLISILKKAGSGR